MLLALEDEEVEPRTGPGLDAFVVGIGDEQMARAAEVTRAIRTAGLSTSTSFGGQGPLGRSSEWRIEPGRPSR